MENYLVVMVLLVLFIIFKHYSSHQSRNSPPRPPPLPVIGHLHLIKDSLHLSLASLSSHYGPIFSLQLGSRSFLVVSSPSAVEECFTKNDTVFTNRPNTMAADRLTYNYATFVWSSYGHFWKTLRRLSVVEFFSSSSLQKSAKLREQEILKIARVLHRKKGEKVDLNNLLCTYSFNILMRALAGKSCVEEEDIGREVGKEALKRIQASFIPSLSLGVCDYFPVLRWIGYKGLEKNLMLMQKKRDELLQSLIDEIRGKSHEVNKSSLTETLLPLQLSEPQFYTDDVIKSILLVMLTAGTDTSALTLEWAMSLLLSHPHELIKLRQEIDDNIGHDHLLSDSELANLAYLRCIVNETLRLHPSVPLLLPHYSSQDCMVGGYNIPKGTILLVNAWAMHMDPNLWEEPEKFNPERFRGMEMGREGFKFVPFGTGRRACPGAAMALRTVSLALGTLVQCFDWEKPFQDMEMDCWVDVWVAFLSGSISRLREPMVRFSPSNCVKPWCGSILDYPPTR